MSPNVIQLKWKACRMIGFGVVGYAVHLDFLTLVSIEKHQSHAGSCWTAYYDITGLFRPAFPVVDAGYLDEIEEYVRQWWANFSPWIVQFDRSEVELP